MRDNPLIFCLALWLALSMGAGTDRSLADPVQAKTTADATENEEAYYRRASLQMMRDDAPYPDYRSNAGIYRKFLAVEEIYSVRLNHTRESVNLESLEVLAGKLSSPTHEVQLAGMREYLATTGMPISNESRARKVGLPGSEADELRDFLRHTRLTVEEYLPVLIDCEAEEVDRVEAAKRIAAKGTHPAVFPVLMEVVENKAEPVAVRVGALQGIVRSGRVESSVPYLLDICRRVSVDEEEGVPPALAGIAYEGLLAFGFWPHRRDDPPWPPSSQPAERNARTLQNQERMEAKWEEVKESFVFPGVDKVDEPLDINVNGY